ncbi:hypothetical protein F4778DRAFT_269715 [Xylariomycetidae sp. FL2044]|nr:hypothetical protein F4778DRAFT_269715 [Xylariomycetidae sp. FL2044]
MAMASKRSADDFSRVDRVSKRPRNDSVFRPAKVSSSGIDQTYGQRGAFDLNDLSTVSAGDSDLDCEDDAAALAYLRSVRFQAAKIPHVLAAKKAGPQLPPQITSETPGTTGSTSIKEEDKSDEEEIDRSIYYNGKGDFRGYYEDGAYVAYPDGHFDGESEEEYDEENEDNYQAGEDAGEELESNDAYSPDSSDGGPHNSSAEEISTAYFTSLTNQYTALRNLLQTEPPESAKASLPQSSPTDVAVFGPLRGTFNEWSNRLRGTDPLPAQVASMHKDSVIRLIRVLLGGKFLRKNHELRERTSRWIWALLARFPDQGELDYQEIGWIRELGKRAVLLMVRPAEHDALKEQYYVGGSGSSNLGDGEAHVDEGIDEELSQPDFEVEGADSGLKDGKTDNTAERRDTIGKEIKTPASRVSDALDEDVEMQLDTDQEEDGEIPEGPTTQASEPNHQAPETDMEKARARLLAQLNAAEEAVEPDLVDEQKKPDPPSSPSRDPNLRSTTAAQQEKQRRSKINERATLNMILTVAGEFYGQRDLLEFRDPFGGLLLESESESDSDE